jgi:hypothetical protein
MWRFDDKTCAILALMSLASLAGMAPVDAHNETVRDLHEHQSPEGARNAALSEAQTRQSRPQSARARAAYASARGQASYAGQRRVANDQRERVGRSINEPRPSAVRVAGEAHLAGGGPVHEMSRDFAAGQIHVVRYHNTLNGTVERTIRPGLTSRTFVSGGHVLYAHVYQQHVWHQFGRVFAYETFVPAVRYPGVYYAWALAAWPRPISYAWDWQVQPWYPVYRSRFTPYPVYTSPDLWMTDYIIAQSMQTAFVAQNVAPASQPVQQGAPALSESSSSDAAPAAQIGDSAPPSQPSDAPPLSQSSAPPAATPALPPPITPQIKAQLNDQIKVLLQEQQTAAATPATLTTESTPPALRPNHVFFQVVQPIDVSSGTANGHCSLSPNDYIKRTGAMSNDDWMIPVVVELSRPSDCPEGLRTRIGLNDLNAMENEQEAEVMAAMQAASQSMGPNGPPSGSGVHPTLIADGNSAPDPMALDAIRRTE